MKSLVMSLAAAGLVVLAARGSASTERKCAHTPVLFPDAPEPVYVLDGRAVDRAAIEEIDGGTVESAYIMCAADLYDRLNVRAQRSGFVVFTIPGPHAQLREGVARLEELQRDHFQRHGTYTDDLERLGWSDTTGLITVEASVFDQGRSWKATASHFYLARPESKLTVSGPTE